MKIEHLFYILNYVETYTWFQRGKSVLSKNIFSQESNIILIDAHKVTDIRVKGPQNQFRQK